MERGANARAARAREWTTLSCLSFAEPEHGADDGHEAVLRGPIVGDEIFLDDVAKVFSRFFLLLLLSGARGAPLRPRTQSTRAFAPLEA